MFFVIKMEITILNGIKKYAGLDKPAYFYSLRCFFISLAINTKTYMIIIPIISFIIAPKCNSITLPPKIIIKFTFSNDLHYSIE